MRTLVAVVVGLMTIGCGATKRIELPRVEVPNSPEGLACQRECLLVFHACHSSVVDFCRLEQLLCLRTCPGASQDGVAVTFEEMTSY